VYFVVQQLSCQSGHHGIFNHEIGYPRRKGKSGNFITTKHTKYTNGTKNQNLKPEWPETKPEARSLNFWPQKGTKGINQRAGTFLTAKLTTQVRHELVAPIKISANANCGHEIHERNA